MDSIGSTDGNQSRGYVAMPRSLEQLPFFAVDGMYLVYQILVWDACYLPSRFDRRKTGQGGTGWAMIPLLRGQAIAVRGDIANRTGLTPDKVRYRIEKLVELGYVSTETVSGYMVATITNYDAFHTPPDYPRKSPQTNSTENTNDFVDASDQSNSSDPGLKDEKSPDYPQTKPRLTPTTNKEKKEKNEKKNTAAALSSSQSLIERPSDVTEQVWSDWLSVRKAKRLPVTATALNGVRTQSELSGKTLNDVLTMCCERGWGSFEAKWLTSDRSKLANNAKPSTQMTKITAPMTIPEAEPTRPRQFSSPNVK